MADLVIAVTPFERTSSRKLLAGAMIAVIALHAILLLIFGERAVSVSRLCTAAVPVTAAFCCWWRAQRMPLRERISWQWISAALLLWSTGQIVETLLAHSTAASNLAADPADFFYITAAFPLLLAISSTTETESIRPILYLNLSQIALAAFLTWFKLFKTPLPSEISASVMMKIYAAECILLAISAVLRLVSWSTREERSRMRMVCGVVWIYLPIELSLDYATQHWNLQAGTLLDLLWSAPFLFAGFQALRLPIEAPRAEPSRVRRRASLIIESLCPILITTGIFALAASIVSRHLVIGLVSIFLLLVSQGLHAAMVQLDYLKSQHLLLEREHELEEANAGLDRLSRLDPLTGISNRRHFNAMLEDVWKRATRRQESLAILMIDVDNFKGINDLHGHTYGDECLTTVARVLAEQVARTRDLLARYGGEEFILLLPETDRDGAMIVAERIQRALAAAGIVSQASPFNQRLTVSIGVGVSIPESGTYATALVSVADKALYEAKRSGRNRVCAGAL